jgi:hypothetical protein
LIARQFEGFLDYVASHPDEYRFEDAESNLAVIGLLYKIGREDPFLGKLLTAGTSPQTTSTPVVIERLNLSEGLTGTHERGCQGKTPVARSKLPPLRSLFGELRRPVQDDRHRNGFR